MNDMKSTQVSFCPTYKSILKCFCYFYHPICWNVSGILKMTHSSPAWYHLHFEWSVLTWYMLRLFICRIAVAILPLGFLSWLSSLSYFSPSRAVFKSPLMKEFFGFRTFLSERHFMTTVSHLPSPLLISNSFKTCHLFNVPYFHFSLIHFLVLTSLSIRALRVLCTSSPSLSISAFKRSFCSVSSCTFFSLSCSLSLRLFFADDKDGDLCCVEEANGDKALLSLSLVVLLRFPRQEDG